MMKIFQTLLICMFFLPAVAQDKIDFSSLPGEWTTHLTELNIAQQGDGYKVYNYAYPASYMFFKEKAAPVLECTSVETGGLVDMFPKDWVGSTITVISKYHIKFSQAGGKTYDWVKREGYTLADNGEFFIRGQKLGKIVKTKKGNMLTGALPESTVSDVNDVPRLRYDGTNQRLVFLDDNKSYIPDKSGYGLNAIARFLAYDSLLLPEGYNEKYRARFIKKYNGFDATAKNERDYSAGVTFPDGNVFQGSVMIGHLESYAIADVSDMKRVVVKDMSGNIVGVIIPEKRQYNMMAATITDKNGKTIATLPETMVAPFRKYEEGVVWLVKNRFL